MPFKSCKSGGKSGTKYGNRGKCYTGKGGRKKAGRQAAAMHARGYKRRG